MGGVDEKIRISLTSALARGEWSASRHCRFTLGERTAGTHWIGGLDDVEKRKFFTLPGLVQPVASCCIDCAIAAHRQELQADTNCLVQ
jgi:hypothetical protein